MKLRLKDSSFRFRITLKELETLEREGAICCEAHFPGPSGTLQTFRFSVRHAADLNRGGLLVDSAAISLLLSTSELRELKNPEQEGVYLREEWIDKSRRVHRSMAFIEKDRPASKCEKPETWIYDD